MEQLFLGIDLGTSAVKLVMINGEKRVVARTFREYQAVQGENGQSEMDPEQWFHQVREGMEEILGRCSREAVKGIGVTGQMHTLVVLDAAGKPLRPAMMWNDTRTKDLLPGLKKQIGACSGDSYLERTVSTGSPAANLFWLKEHEPSCFRKIRKFLIGPDYLVYRLTGKAGTDYCEASTSCLYDIGHRQWSPEIQKLLELDASAYPEVRGSAQAAGTLTEEMANLFGLDRETEVITGTGDNPATAISTGCLGCGYPVISLGTSGVFMMPAEEPGHWARGKVILFSFDGSKFSCLVQGAVQSNGSTFDWWVRSVMGIENFSQADQMIDPGQAVKSSVLFYPHLMGEKTLYGDPGIRGAFVGLSTETGAEELLYAVMEGLCFSFLELAEKMELPLKQLGSIKVVGGGAESRAWLQIMANVLDIRIEKLDGMVGPAFGIALLAAWKGGCIPSLEQLSEGTVKIDYAFEPEPAAAAACRKKYERYLRMQRGLRYITEGVLPEEG